MLNQIDCVNVTNVIVSLHQNLAVNSQLKVFTDGFDAVGLFEKNSPACHFYSNMMCIEDVDVYAETKSESSIYVVDSCQREVIHFVFSVNETINIKNKYRVARGVPVGAVRSSANSLTVLTKYPSQLLVVKL